MSFRVTKNASLITHLHRDLIGVGDPTMNLGRRNKEHKCPGVGLCLEFSRNPHIVRMKWSQGKGKNQGAAGESQGGPYGRS